MKLASALSSLIQALSAQGVRPGFDEARVKELLEAIERRGYARGQSLLAKWAQIRSDLGA